MMLVLELPRFRSNCLFAKMNKVEMSKVGLPLMNLVRLKDAPILQQLHLEERLLRTSSDNWCVINDGTNHPHHCHGSFWIMFLAPISLVGMLSQLQRIDGCTKHLSYGTTRSEICLISNCQNVLLTIGRLGVTWSVSAV